MKAEPKSKNGKIAYKVFLICATAIIALGILAIIFVSIDWPFIHSGGYLGFFETLGLAMLISGPLLVCLGGLFGSINYILCCVTDVRKPALFDKIIHTVSVICGGYALVILFSGFNLLIGAFSAIYFACAIISAAIWCINGMKLLKKHQNIIPKK